MIFARRSVIIKAVSMMGINAHCLDAKNSALEKCLIIMYVRRSVILRNVTGIIKSAYVILSVRQMSWIMKDVMTFVHNQSSANLKTINVDTVH
mmetsp:Transcript_27021/g.4991  ORF Transcript_27021/g.4991 Transcript_27021/m.4991 type:complete len:93 (-) Transcript_27021:46-324(-)